MLEPQAGWGLGEAPGFKTLEDGSICVEKVALEKRQVGGLPGQVLADVALCSPETRRRNHSGG